MAVTSPRSEGGQGTRLGQVARTETSLQRTLNILTSFLAIDLFHLKGARVVHVARHITDIVLLEGRKTDESHLLLCFRMPSTQYLLNT